MSLSREEILGVKDFDVEEVNVPEWGGAVYVRPMTGRDRDKTEAEMFADGNRESEGVDPKCLYDRRARIVARTLCDKEGNLLFSDSDIGPLSEKSGIVLDLLYEKGMAISKWTDDEIEAVKKN